MLIEERIIRHQNNINKLYDKKNSLELELSEIDNKIKFHSDSINNLENKKHKTLRFVNTKISHIKRIEWI